MQLNITRPHHATFLALLFSLVFSLGYSSAISAQTTTATLIQTIDATAWNPPSPDSAGIVYIEHLTRLLVSDSEVDELGSFFQDANLFEIDLDGMLLGTLDALAAFNGNEPTGLAYNPANDHLFISQDSLDRIFEIAPQADGTYDLADGTSRSFIATPTFGNDDPEGVTYNTALGFLHIADGINSEVYTVNPGPNGVFDGISPGDDIITNFDTLVLGQEDPEGIAYDPSSGNLYIIGQPFTDLAEVTTDGVLVRTIDISAANAIKPAGLAIAPSSSGIPGQMSLWIVDRGIDSGVGNIQNDGKVYEMNISGLAGTPITLLARVDASSDDAEERASGAMKLASSDLELVSDGGGNQQVGMRFNNLGIPKDATIQNAFIQFEADEANSGTTSLNIQGEAADHASTFTSVNGNISSRPRTSSVQWNLVPPWSVGMAGSGQRTPDITPIIQEIVSRNGWMSSNSLAIIVTGTGERTAEAFDGDSPSAAPLLSVEYLDNGLGNPGNPNAPPSVTITAPTIPSTFTVGTFIDFFGNATDSEDNNTTLTASLSWTSSLQQGSIGTGGSFSTDTLIPGIHIITASVTDSGGASASAMITVTVNAAGLNSTDVRVKAGSDDAEENDSGIMKLTSSDLELVFDKGNQQVGMRFNNLGIPQAAIIQNAYLQFQVDEPNSGAMMLTIEGEKIANAQTFTKTKNNISSRIRTMSSVVWNPAAWPSTGEAGPNQKTPDLKSIIQEIVNQANWSPSNSMALFVTGTGERTAESFDGNPNAAALLHIDYLVGSNFPPIATITTPPNASAFTDTMAIAFSGFATDVEDDDNTLTTSLSWTSSKDGPIGTGASFSTTLTAGVHNITATVTDSEGLSASDEITVTVNIEGLNTLDKRVESGTDDAEEKASGGVNLTSSDLELVFTGTNQTVGIRFTDLGIPNNATIENAYVEFQVDETDSGIASLLIEGEATDNALTFTSASLNISSRSRTASVPWNPTSWPVVGELQQTPDIKSIIQEIVSRPGWAPNNALAIIVTGTGVRTAESFNGVATAAPLLHMEYTIP